MFLLPNRHIVTAGAEEIVVTFLALASGDLTDNELAVWFREPIVPA